jgi:hypothetical protein
VRLEEYKNKTYPFPEFGRVGESALEGVEVEARFVLREVITDILVHHAEYHHRKGSEADVVAAAGAAEFKVELLGGARAEEEPELTHSEQYILVEHISNESESPEEIKPAVHQQEPLEEPELGYRKVGGVNGLSSFETGYTDADVRFENHRDVIGAVTDAEAGSARHALPVLFTIDFGLKASPR